MATDPLVNGHHSDLANGAHPYLVDPDADQLKSSRPSSDPEDQRQSASPEAPPTGIEDAATLKPLTCEGRPHDTIMTDSTHCGGQQAAAAAVDMRLDGPALYTDPPVPHSNGHADLSINSPVTEPLLVEIGHADMSINSPATAPLVGGAIQELQNGTQYPAHAGKGLLPSAPPPFPGLEDPADTEEGYTPLTSEAQSPAQALKRANSRSPVDNEASKRLRIDSNNTPPCDAPVAGPSSSSPRASSVVDALEPPLLSKEIFQPQLPPGPTHATGPTSVPPVYETEPTPPPEPIREWFVPGTHGTRMSLRQQKYLRNVMSSVKKHRCSGPFAQPVDPVALGIPHYPKVIKRPMDLSKVDIRLGKTGKPTYYDSVQEFVSDMQLIFENCYKFNGPPSNAGISKMATELASHFEIQMKRVPADELPPPPPVVAPPPKKPVKPASPPRTATRPPEAKDAYVAKWNAGVEAARDRPKREIKVPDKELPYFAEQAEKEASRPKTQKRRESAAVAPKMVPNSKEELKFAREVLREVNSKKHYKMAWPFYTAVDYVAMGIPDYPRIITKPMDLGTVKSKLETGEYKNGAAFAGDMRLIFNNCYTYNGLDSQVGQLGKQLEQVFEMKWLERPPEKVPATQFKPETDSDEEKQRHLKAQIEALQAQYAQGEAAKKQKKVKPLKPSAPPPRPKSNGASRQSQPKSAQSATMKTKKSSARYKDDEDEEDDFYRDEGIQYADDDDYEVITYEQKKGLAQSIGDADENMMTKAIELIREKRPDLMGPSNEEIELDIDAMDDKTLYKLYVLICGPPRGKQRNRKPPPLKKIATKPGAPAPRSSVPKSGRRQTLDLDAEAAQIEQLRAKLDQYEGAGGGTAHPAPPKAPEYASSSSDSESSDEDSD